MSGGLSSSGGGLGGFLRQAKGCRKNLWSTWEKGHIKVGVTVTSPRKIGMIYDDLVCLQCCLQLKDSSFIMQIMYRKTCLSMYGRRSW